MNWAPLDIPTEAGKPFTDYSRWRLLVNDGGRHTWHYLHHEDELESWPQNDVDRYWLGLGLVGLGFLSGSQLTYHLFRTYPITFQLARLSKLRGTVMNFTSICNRMTVTGQASTVDRCSCCQGLSLAAM